MCFNTNALKSIEASVNCVIIACNVWCQAIARSNANHNNSVKLESKYNDYHSGKYVSKCNLRNIGFFSGFHVINVINTSYTHSYHCHTLLCKGLIVYTICVNGLTRSLNYVNALFLVTFMRYLSLAYLHFLWMGFWIWHYMAMLTLHYSNRGVICHVNVFIDSIWVTRLWYSIHL